MNSPSSPSPSSSPSLGIFGASHLKKTYSKRSVVNDVSIDIKQGEVVGLLGPNGAGKTTTFYMMVGLIKADMGNIYLNDQDVTQLPIHKRARLGIGYLPQEASIFRELTVEDNIYAAIESRDISKSEKKNILQQLIEDFSLQLIRKSTGNQLSGGERRRVEIARTLSLEPSFVLLDEPFAGVDPLAVKEIQYIIGELKKRNIGVLITDHNVRETLGIVERAYIMGLGKIIEAGTPQEIIQSEKARKYYLGDEFKL